MLTSIFKKLILTLSSLMLMVSTSLKIDVKSIKKMILKVYFSVMYIKRFNKNNVIFLLK